MCSARRLRRALSTFWFYFAPTAPTQIGVVVGCGLPPSGSSVIAKALVAPGESGGFATSKSKFPSAVGRNVDDGNGFAPDALGINHNCSVRFLDGICNFCPETTRPNSEFHVACNTD